MTQRYRNEEPSTSELRHDWLSDRWVIIAPQRTQRPDDFARTCDSSPIVSRNRPTESELGCPFCRGHEKETPPPLAVYSAQGPCTASAELSCNNEPWLVRVVPNKFPAVNGVQSLKFASMVGVEASIVGVEGISSVLDGSIAPITDLEPVLGEGAIASGEQNAQEVQSKRSIDLFHARHVTGAHEVIIESPQHLCSLTELDRQSTTMIFRAYRDRLRYWSNCLDVAYAVVFKNVGLDAGASLVHTHSQLIATNILPTDVRRSIERMELYYATEHACLFCRMLTDELEENVRIVAQTSDFVAFCPFASRLPSLVTIIPREHESAFETTSDDSLEQLSWLVHRILRSIENCYPQAAYNYVLHTAPQGKRDSPAVHWRLEIFPRLTRVAGFEWGSDCFINPLPPELAASRLRGNASTR
jgi:galactose-1-phosphate uridylyltransferase